MTTVPAGNKGAIGAIVAMPAITNSYPTNIVAVITRGALQVACTSMWDALDTLRNGDVLLVYPGEHSIDRCDDLNKPWSRRGLSDVSIIGLGKSVLLGKAGHYAGMYFYGVTNFFMQNVTIIATGVYRYAFSVDSANGCVIEGCRLMLYTTYPVGESKTLVVMGTNCIVRNSVIASFNSTNVANMLHMATHGTAPVFVDNCDFIDNGRVRTTVGAWSTRRCRATSLYQRYPAFAPLTRQQAAALVDGFMSHMISAPRDSFVEHNQYEAPFFPVYGSYAFVGPQLPTIPGYCAQTVSEVLYNGFTGTVCVFGFQPDDTVSRFGVYDKRNVHVLIKFNGNIMVSKCSRLVDIYRVQDSYIEYDGMRGIDAVSTSPLSFGLVCTYMTNSTIVLKNCVFEKRYDSDRFIPLAGETQYHASNVSNVCMTFNVHRVSRTNVLFSLNAYGTINVNTYDWTNWYDCKPIFTP